jgi:8-oxo-dGTP pyrophosphatase MutT (NUDIX family)
MEREALIHALNNYQTSFDEEKAFISRFKSLLRNFENCYKRSLLTGHITASAWISNKTGTSAVLVHHKKLNRWLQPGGHADGDENVLNVASKEAQEETGLKSLKLIGDKIFDIDIHLIPKHGNIQAHYHYDIRFLFVADDTEDYVISDESNELKWIPLGSINQFTGNNNSILRMVLKSKLIFK